MNPSPQPNSTWPTSPDAELYIRMSPNVCVISSPTELVIFVILVTTSGPFIVTSPLSLSIISVITVVGARVYSLSMHILSI